MKSEQDKGFRIPSAKRLLRLALSGMTRLRWLRLVGGSITRRVPGLHRMLVRVVTGTDTISARNKPPAAAAPRSALEACLSVDARMLYRQLSASSAHDPGKQD